MPNYKTHSIHTEKTYPYLDKRIDLDLNDLKVFSFGPDTLIFSDPIVFNMQHSKHSKHFFMGLLKEIKEKHMHDKKEIISFLYGQISHFILDYTFHPYVYYITTNMKNNKIIGSHLQFELWLDSYIMNKYKVYEKHYFKDKRISDSLVRKTIDYVYLKVYKCLFASDKYNLGIKSIQSIESNIRYNKKLSSFVKSTNIGDLAYHNKDTEIKDYCNADRDIWTNPITGEAHVESINELWNNACSTFIETIDDVNKYLYDDKELTNPLLTEDISYDTGLPSDVPKKLKFVKKY